MGRPVALKALDRRFQRLPLLVRNGLFAAVTGALAALLVGGGWSDFATSFLVVYVVFTLGDLATLQLMDARRVYEDTRANYPWARGRQR